nr:hypothetical protein CFP56_02761 [Quercus suber]
MRASCTRQILRIHSFIFGRRICTRGISCVSSNQERLPADTTNMAKVAKPKKKDVSVHSRAARRGGSPSADLNVKPPVDETDYKPWLHNAQNAGISKKKKTKQLTRQQRERHEKGLANAERNLDKHEKKVAGSKARARRVDERRAAWEDLNTKFTEADEAEAKKISKAVKAGSVVQTPLSNVEASAAALPTDVVEMTGATPHAAANQTEQSTAIPAAEEEIDEIT